MGTRGFVAVKANDTVHVTYNSMSSHPDCLGVEVLNDARTLTEQHSPHALRQMAASLVDAKASGLTVRQAMDAYPAFAAHIASVYPEGMPERAPSLDSADDEAWQWFGDTYGLAEMLTQQVYESNTFFPVYGGTCEWGYLLDLDRDNGPDRAPGVLEVYRGRHTTRPVAGLWANRPTPEEEAEDHQWHLDWCAEHGREPWLPAEAPYKACAPIAAWALDSLPSPEALASLNVLRDNTLDDTLVPFAAAGVVAGVGPVFESWAGLATAETTR